MKYDRTIKKIEKAVDEIRAIKGSFRYVFMEPDETKEQCLLRHGLEGDHPGLTICFIKWVSGEGRLPISPEQQTAGHEKENSISPKNETDTPSDTANLDAQIEKITTELENEGYSREEIDEMVAGPDYPDSKAKPQRDKAGSNEPKKSETPINAESTELDDGLLKVEPMRADPFLTGMSR